MLIPVLLSGGIGSRLWPISRELYPKQFISLVDEDKSLLQSTLSRLEGIDNIASTIVVCHEDHRFLVAEQLRQSGMESSTIIIEPDSKGTAPAVALAAYEALKQYEDEDPILLVLPVDHIINNRDSFHKAIEKGVDQASAGKLVTFGVHPSSAATQYGYIRSGMPIDHIDHLFEVSDFIEKPDQITAENLIAKNSCYWNSGMFMFKASSYQRKLQKYAPDILDVCEKSYEKVSDDLDFKRIPKHIFETCRSDSVDCAVLEHTREAVVIGLDAEWKEICAWSSLWESGQKDSRGNVVNGDVITHDVENCYIGGGSRLVAALGIKDLVVVETPDAVLVADKNKVEDVQHIVEQLRQNGRTEALNHTCVYRPWGSYETLVLAERFQVKRIIVNPGATLSLQMHHHRAEHWTVVRGTALVTCGDEEFLLREDESNYIPLGHKHRLKNPGVIPLELIEVQTGSYLGEDDIVRFEDSYGR